MAVCFSGDAPGRHESTADHLSRPDDQAARPRPLRPEAKYRRALPAPQYPWPGTDRPWASAGVHRGGIGTFTGYSALAVARGLGPGGRLLCCDTSQQWTSIARAAWQEAGVADRIELQVGPGLDTLRALPPGEQFDFAFIDHPKMHTRADSRTHDQWLRLIS